MGKVSDADQGTQGNSMEGTQPDEKCVVLKTKPRIEGQTFPGYSGASPGIWLWGMDDDSKINQSYPWCLDLNIDIEILFCVEYCTTCNISPLGLLLWQTRINKYFF